MNIFVRLLVVALPLLFSSSVLAQHQTFTVSPETSDVSFALGGSGHETHGSFHVQNGAIDFDPTKNNTNLPVSVCYGRAAFCRNWSCAWAALEASANVEWMSS
jgi:hypothetical protein